MAASRAQAAQASATSTSGASSNWSPEEIQLLVKAVTLYPAGTVKRWDTIATYVNTHSSGKTRNKTAKNVISQVKSMQKLEASDKEAQNKLAFSEFEQKQKVKGKVVPGGEATPTERYGKICVFDCQSPSLFLHQMCRSRGLLRNRRYSVSLCRARVQYHLGLSSS